MNILLPTDFSENSWNAISYAIDLFEPVVCNFYLLHVNRADTFMAGDSGYVPTADQIEEIYVKPSKQKLRTLLNDIQDHHKPNNNHKFYALSDYGFFIESIRKYVTKKKIDLLVMGTKGASGLKEYIVGSNTGDIITKVKCTTLVVPEDAKYNTIKEIAFPTDYNLSYDLMALQPFTDILKMVNASLRVVHIQKTGAELNTEQLENKDVLNDYFEEFKPSYHFLTNAKVEDAIQCFVESRDINMIAMVAKNLNYFQSILFHSNVEKITYHTNIPFLVLHE
ncbi:universal stress protein [Winogradskyella psychrotolerans]|uniref:universal stress protein n=1 Tax=Winogradskyella psychrotolerans TaxID=1344585 RepID=UPI001C070E8A|nr:universal stress protein [Winogradskyella psychrotolerans]MBU2928622.1 universal stress protein [Winogradskyella psychrotolerans]